MILEVLAQLDGAGFQAVLVGGGVRDLLLGRPPADFDIATSATPADVQRIFPRTIPTGVQHGTVTVLHRGKPVEVTTFRSEGAYLDGRHPQTVEFHGDIRADLSRRDFTINAIAWHTRDGLHRLLTSSMAWAISTAKSYAPLASRRSAFLKTACAPFERCALRRS